MNYQIKNSTKYLRQFKHLIRNNKHLKSKIIEVIEKMISDPFDLSLRTHNVGQEDGNKLWSSRVTGDIRIIWTFDEDKKVIIILLKIGGHDDVYF